MTPASARKGLWARLPRIVRPFSPVAASSAPDIRSTPVLLLQDVTGYNIVAGFKMPLGDFGDEGDGRH